MYCLKCGSQLPDDAAFCSKCGARTTTTSEILQPQSNSGSVGAGQILAPSNAQSLKCPSCGAPIAPRFGETMLPLTIQSANEISNRVKSMMDRGMLHRHLQESSTLEEMTLSVVPYWLVNVSARTSIVATDMVAEGATVATTAALIGVMAGLGGGRRGGFGAPLLGGAMLGSMMGSGIGAGGGQKKAIQMDQNYNFPIIALKALTQYQPHDYQFAIQGRTLFDISQYPKGIKVLNGDISEDAAKYQAKTLVDQLQSKKAHAQYHMIQQITSQEDVSDTELLHVPIWFVRYDHSGNKIVLVVDGNSGNVINSLGL